MAHHQTETTLSTAESEFIDYMQRGDDFFKIQLLRPAKNWYKRALEMNIRTEDVKQKIAECDRELAFELKVIKILAVVVAVVVLLIVFL